MTLMLSAIVILLMLPLGLLLYLWVTDLFHFFIIKLPFFLYPYIFWNMANWIFSGKAIRNVKTGHKFDWERPLWRILYWFAQGRCPLGWISVYDIHRERWQVWSWGSRLETMERDCERVVGRGKCFLRSAIIILSRYFILRNEIGK